MANDIIGTVNDSDVTLAPEPNAAQPQVAGATANNPVASGNIIGSVDDSDVLTPEQHFGSIPQQLGTAAESAASIASFGLSRGAESFVGKKLGLDELSPESQRARESENPISNVVGGIGGFASTLGAAGAIGAIGKAGAAGAEALGIGSKALQAAVKYGIEGALAQGSNEVGKLVTGDPEQTVGNAAINVGLSGIIGGGIGGVTGGLGSLWQAKFGAKVGSALDSAIEAVSNDSNVANEGGINSLKPNAPEIADSLNRLKIEPTPSILSGSQFAQTLEGNLAERGSLASVALNKERGAIFNKLADSAEDTLTDATSKSQATVGREIKKDISDKLLSDLKPIEEGYKNAEGELKSVPVSEDLKAEAVNPILEHDYVKLDPEAKGVAKKILGQINQIDNVNDLKKVRSLISSQLNEAYGSGQGGGPKAQILQTAKDALTALREKALNEASESGIVKPEALENIKSLDAQYAGFQNSVKQLGVEGGLGKANSARALLAKFDNLSDESFTNKVFDTGDARNMGFFKENFPDAFEKARQFKLSEIADNSIDHSQGKNGKFSTQKFLTQVRNLGDEAKQVLFKGSDLQKISDIENVHEAIAGTPNTSHTSYSQAFANVLSPSGLLSNLTDAAQYAVLKALPHLNEAAELTGGDAASKLGALSVAANADKGSNPQAFKAMVDYIRSTIKGQSSLANGVKNLFEAGKVIIPTHLLPDQSSRDRLQKSLDLASNFDNAINIGNDIAHYLPSHATAQAQTVAQASNYLNSLKPTQPVTNPLDKVPPINKADQTKYNRALDIAQQPLMVLKHVKDGTLLPQDVQTLQAIYPSLHNALVQKIGEQLIQKKTDGQAIPYHQRVSLSQLLDGNPLDSTMTSASAQAIIHSAGSQQAAQQQGSSGRSQPKVSQATLSQVNKVNALYATPLQARQFQKVKS